MKIVKWNEDKNQLLKLQRGVCFEDILEKIEKKDILARVKHPNDIKYPNQMIFIFEIKEYIYYVPYVEDDEKIFLKTIIPSRKLTKEYKRKSDEK
jgi:hypothetical protein